MCLQLIIVQTACVDCKQKILPAFLIFDLIGLNSTQMPSKWTGRSKFMSSRILGLNFVGIRRSIPLLSFDQSVVYFAHIVYGLTYRRSR